MFSAANMAKALGCAETIEKVVAILCLKVRLAINISGATNRNSIINGTADENSKPNVWALISISFWNKSKSTPLLPSSTQENKS
ncbi:hypothetical protein ALTERO38_51395 [Alteromonas sp. 38]|nr:hypothetical protein ALTERO38_51395 [Alteromonas sp. 38]